MLKIDVPRVSDEVAIERYSICEGCPSLKLGICTECGCRMKWKVRLSAASCPIGKWESDVPAKKFIEEEKQASEKVKFTQ
jgi:hypothetical protein